MALSGISSAFGLRARHQQAARLNVKVVKSSLQARSMEVHHKNIKPSIVSTDRYLGGLRT